MNDNKNKVGGQDRSRINVNEDYELRGWAQSLDTTPDRVVAAVSAVGDRADDVRRHLQEKAARG